MNTATRWLMFAALGTLQAPECLADEVFHIPEGSAAEALEKFTDQSGRNLIYKSDDLAGITTQAVEGELDPLEAIQLMLKGTNIVAKPVGSKSITLVTVEVQKELVAEEKSRLDGLKPPKTDSPPTLVMEQEVVVAGSQIRGGSRIGSNETVIGSEQISGSISGTLPGVLEANTIAHGAGAHEDTFEWGSDAQGNAGLGSAINLRGLGTGSTLALLNGHRLAPSGLDGTFIDISNIPLVAIDRIEIVADGASAAYGSDAVGGVVNFVTKRDYNDLFTMARFGTGIDDTLTERQIGQVMGKQWGDFSGILAVELYSSEALPASKRDRANSDLRRYGGYNFDTELANPGNIFTRSGPYAIPATQDGTSLTFEDLLPGQRNLRNLYERTDVIASQKRWSLFSTVRYDATDNLKFFLDSLYTKREAQAAAGSFSGIVEVPGSNPFAAGLSTHGESILVAYDFGDDFGAKTIVADVTVRNAVATAELAMTHDLSLETFLGYASEREDQRVDNLVDIFSLEEALRDPNPETAFNPLGDGSHTAPSTLEHLRTQGHTRNNSALLSGGTKLSGPLHRFKNREVHFALGGEARRQRLHTRVFSGGAGVNADYSLSRDVRAAFGQIDLRGGAASRTLPPLARFDLSISARYEDFENAGDAFTQRFGVDWAPHPWVRFRGSWAESFRLPALGQLYDGQNGSLIHILPDASSPLGFSTALFEFGKNPDLGPETAESWSWGVDFDPAPRLSLSLSYFDIVARNRIESTNVSTTLFSDANLGYLITRNAVGEDREAICRRTTFYGSPGACLGAPIDATVDLRLRNISVLETRGIDFKGRYGFDTRLGPFTIDLLATYIVDFEQAQTPNHVLIELVDTQNQPIDFRAIGSIAWHRGGLGVQAVVNYFDSYTDVETQPNRHVTSWTTVDATMRYAFNENHDALFDDVTISLSAENLLNRDPPFLNNFDGVGYDPENADLKGMRLTFKLQKNW